MLRAVYVRGIVMPAYRDFDSQDEVLKAIRARGTHGFTGSDIAEEAGLCRQTVYKIIARLNSEGHRIEGMPRLGFMARLKPH